MTVVCRDNYVRRKAGKFLDHPCTASLNEMIVINAMESHWSSKVEGEGGVNRMDKRKQRRRGSIERSKQRLLVNPGDTTMEDIDEEIAE